MKKVIAFDMDGTLAVTKSAITDRMSDLLGQLLETHQVCVISGGAFPQFEKQLVANLNVPHHVLANLHLMPTCGTRYFRYDDIESTWKQIYAEDLEADEKKLIIKTLKDGAQALGYWEENPDGEIIEDRGSQVTLSALGQQATAERKEAWDPDGTKKKALRDWVAERIPQFEVRAGGTTSIDVTRLGIDKAYGMEKLMQTLEVGKEDILFVGDRLEEGGNDYPVKAFGIDTIAVRDWLDTSLVIETVIALQD